MGECKRQGAWLVPASHTAFSLMGSVTLDLRGATFAEPDITITANAIMGEVKVIVDAGTNVVVSGVPIMGEFHQAKDKVAPQLGPESPIVRVKGMALMGSVSVQRLPTAGYPEEDPRDVLIASGCGLIRAARLGRGRRPARPVETRERHREVS